MNIIKKGTILVATPDIIGDTMFSRSVVLLTEYENEEAIGFVLNKPSNFFLDSLFSEVKNTFRVYVGGPVQNNELFYIHKCPDLISDSIAITEKIYIGGNFDEIIELIRQQKITPAEIKFFLGYSGWSKSQLKEEIESKSWKTLNGMITDKIFSDCRVSLWKDYLQKLGNDFLIWKNAPENPQHN